MCLRALRRLLLACSLALMPFFAVSWEFKISDLEEKDVEEFSSNGLKCPTCIAVRGRKCNTELKWCAEDKIKCLEFSGILNTGTDNIIIEIKRCIKADLCKESITSYMGIPAATQSINCRPASTSGAKMQTKSPIFFVLFLEKLLH